jgi:hypothetical protein
MLGACRQRVGAREVPRPNPAIDVLGQPLQQLGLRSACARRRAPSLSRAAVLRCHAASSAMRRLMRELWSPRLSGPP